MLYEINFEELDYHYIKESISKGTKKEYIFIFKQKFIDKQQ